MTIPAIDGGELEATERRLRQAYDATIDEARRRRDEGREEARLGHLSNIVNRAFGVQADLMGQDWTPLPVQVVQRLPRGRDVQVTGGQILVSERARNAITPAFGERPLTESRAADAAYRLDTLQDEAIRAVLGGTTTPTPGLVPTEAELDLQYAIRGAMATSQRAQFLQGLYDGQPDAVMEQGRGIAGIEPLPGTATPSGALHAVSRYLSAGLRRNGQPEATSDTVISDLARPGGALRNLTEHALQAYDQRLLQIFSHLDPGGQDEIVQRVTAALDPILQGTDPVRSGRPADWRTVQMADGTVLRRSGPWVSSVSQKEQRRQGFGTRSRLAGLQAATELHKVVIDIADDWSTDDVRLRHSEQSVEREKADFELFMATKARGQTFGDAAREAGRWRSEARRMHLGVRARELGNAVRDLTTEKVGAGVEHAKAGWRHTKEGLNTGRKAVGTGVGKGLQATVSFGKALGDVGRAAGDGLADAGLTTAAWVGDKTVAAREAHRSKNNGPTPLQQDNINNDYDFGR